MAQDLKPADRLYQLLVEEEDARVCKDISDEACREVPGNFFRLGIAQTLTKLADEISNAKTVLPWLLSAMEASNAWVGFLVPIRESVSLLPQLLIASAIRQRPLRKNVWVVGAILQALALGALAGAALVLRGPWAGAAVLLLLLLFSLARGICSVASKDVLGKTIPKTRRGRLTGYTVAVSGVLTLGVGLLLASRIDEATSPGLFVMLLAVASGLWIISAIVFATVREEPGATEGGGNALTEALKRLAILRTDRAFRRFVIVRSLLISTALAGPYYVLLASESGRGGEMLGWFVLASGLASALSSAFWGRFADRSSRSVLLASAGLASALGVLMFAVATIDRFSPAVGWIAPIAFFVLAIAHSGVRIGRKTYVLDLAGAERRIDYVAVGNTVVGIVLLGSGLLGLLANVVGTAGMLLILSLIGFAGVALGRWLPETE